jgi:hypothetical protein
MFLIMYPVGFKTTAGHVEDMFTWWLGFLNGRGGALSVSLYFFFFLSLSLSLSLSPSPSLSLQPMVGHSVNQPTKCEASCPVLAWRASVAVCDE